MPDADPSPAGGAISLQRRRFRSGPFAGWAFVGALWALSLASAFSIGVFLMPVALVLTVVMCLGYARPEGWPGALAGGALAGFYLAFLHRHGPGRYCSAPGDAATCRELLNPWPLLAGGLVLLAVCALVSWRWYTRLVVPRRWLR